MEPIPLLTSQLMNNSGSSFESFLPLADLPVVAQTNKDSTERQNTSQWDNSQKADVYFEPVVGLPVLSELKTGKERKEVIFLQRTNYFVS